MGKSMDAKGLDVVSFRMLTKMLLCLFWTKVLVTLSHKKLYLHLHSQNSCLKMLKSQAQILLAKKGAAS